MSLFHNRMWQFPPVPSPTADPTVGLLNYRNIILEGSMEYSREDQLLETATHGGGTIKVMGGNAKQKKKKLLSEDSDSGTLTHLPVTL